MNDWQTILAVDADKWASASYAANFHGVDVRCCTILDALPSMREGMADVIVGGPPCQPFSSAGKGEGEDDARDAIPDFIESVRIVRPRMFLMENVDALLDRRHAAYAGRITQWMESLGYVVQVRELDAVAFGVPQFRKRAWWWGIRQDVDARHCWPRPTHAWPPPDGCMFGASLAAGITVGQALGLVCRTNQDGRCVGRRVTPELGGFAGLHRRRAKSVERRDHPVDEPFPSITSAFALGGGGGLFLKGLERIEGASGYSGQRIIENDQPAPTVIGRSNQELVRIIRAGSPPVMIYDAQNEKHHTIDRPSNTMQGTAQSRGGKAGLYLAQIDGLQIVGNEDTPSHTISGQSREPIQNWKSKKYVRRLTPDECMRLMSAPDDYRWPDGISKTNKYRIAGNGWASGLAWRLSQALKQADPQSRTVIDLCCGGGLGAVGWHGRYWAWEQTGDCLTCRNRCDRGQNRVENEEAKGE